MNQQRSSFSGKFGFILASAGSAIGLGNIWRFPYLAAKDGGGLFLIIYIILALTFGFTLLMSEVSIGRKTKQSSLTAYAKINKKFGWVGIFSSLIPFLILPYYCVIGGWIVKYVITFVSGHSAQAASDEYFTSFISSNISPILFDVIFLFGTAAIVIIGVQKGIEKFTKYIMPIVFVMVIGISLFAISSENPETGITGLDGLKVYLVPSLKSLSVSDVFYVIVDAMGQLFFSISVSMGIMITYGSYFKDDLNLVKSVNQIELFDTLIALLAGVMIVPSVIVFMGPEGMSTGPSLMFVALPKVFDAMGTIGPLVGAFFFIMVLFAAITSSVSILEAVVASLIDKFGWQRRKATIIECAFALAIGIFICLGYNALYFDISLPNGSTGQLLDILDYISNNILMPIVSVATCILIGWVVKPDYVINEATKNGETFRRRILYKIVVCFIAPLLLILLLLGALGII